MPDEYFDKAVASFSFHHLSDQDKEIRRVLKPDGRLISFESNPITGRGKMVKLIETYCIQVKFYEPVQLGKKAEECDVNVISVDSPSLGFLIATKKTERKIY